MQESMADSAGHETWIGYRLTDIKLLYHNGYAC